MRKLASSAVTVLPLRLPCNRWVEMALHLSTSKSGAVEKGRGFTWGLGVIWLGKPRTPLRHLRNSEGGGLGTDTEEHRQAGNVHEERP